MNLLQFRQFFRTRSGRYDLVNVDGTDNGADVFINEGRKFLDRLDETQKSWASCFRFLEINKFSVTFPYCRAVKEVWAATTTARWQLEKMSLQELISTYMNELPQNRDSGDSLYYSPAISRYIPENANLNTFEAFIGYVDVMSGNSHEFNSLLIQPASSEKTLIEVKGLFYSAELVNETDENYWSVNHPLLLYMATMWFIETVNRNTQGVNDWANSIAVVMKQLGMDLVEELIAEVTEMEPETTSSLDYWSRP